MKKLQGANDREAPPRVCIATTRRLKRQVFRCGLYEAEDVLAQIDAVDLIELEPDQGHVWRDRWQRRLIYRDVSERLLRLNPGLKRVELKRDYDLFVAICQNHEDMIYLNAIDGWKDRCRTSVCWIDEVWARTIAKFKPFLMALRQFDHVLVGSSASSVDAISQAIGRPCTWMPLGVDTQRFCPFPRPAQRTIDVLGMGYVPPGVHKALLQKAARKDLFYLHDTYIASTAPVLDFREHRDQLARLIQRSRHMYVSPAKMHLPEETHGQIEYGPRFYEGAAAGAVLVGQKPDCEPFRKMFDWQDVVVEVAPDGSNVIEVLADLAADPQRLEQISLRNVTETLKRHDWLHRWQEIYRIAGLELSQGMALRRKQLDGLAELAGAVCSNLMVLPDRHIA